MTRSRASAKTAGTKFETSIVTWLADQLQDDRIERRAKTGAKDRGDVTGVRTFRNGRVVIEAKDYGGRYLIGPWLREANTERLHDDAAVGAVVAKRRGTTNPGEQVVILTLADFVACLTGERPPDAPLRPLAQPPVDLHPPAGTSALGGTSDV